MGDRGIIDQAVALVADFGKHLSRVEQKFLADLVLGILRSQSVQLASIARASGEGKNLRTVFNRLDINLGKYDLSRAYERAQRKMLAQLDEGTLLIFDPSDIVKPFAKKLEGLRLVRDGSAGLTRVLDRRTKQLRDGPVLRPGYPLRVAIALNPSGDVLPVELSIYSAASESFLSENDEHLQPLSTLLMKTDFKTLLVLDRGFDSYIFIRHFCELKQRFIIRLKSNRKYRIVGSVRGSWVPTYSREQMCDKHAFLESKAVVSYTRNGLQEPLLFELTASHVQLLPEAKRKGAIRQPDELDLLTLVRVRIRKDEKTPTLYLLTNSKPTTAEDLEKIGRAYLARWNVEEYIRFLKQHYGLEKFLVRDLGRMKNLVAAVYIATSVIHLLTDRTQVRGQRVHHHLLRCSRPVAKPKPARDFFLYSYGRGLSEIVGANRMLLNRLNTGFKKSGTFSEDQLAFSLLE